MNDELGLELRDGNKLAEFNRFNYIYCHFFIKNKAYPARIDYVFKKYRAQYIYMH